MIVSHKHKFIFFAVPRTGTHTMRAALGEHLDGSDWQQQALTENRRLPLPELAAVGHGHISFQQLAAAIPEDIWKSYFKFAFVRNPFDRYVSVCSFLNRQTPDFASRARQFMKNALERERFQSRMLVRPQYEMLIGGDGQLAMDYVGRYETLQTSYDHVCREIGVAAVPLPHKNDSAHARYVAYYDEPLEQKVRAFYRHDFELLGYDLFL